MDSALVKAFRSIQPFRCRVMGLLTPSEILNLSVATGCILENEERMVFVSPARDLFHDTLWTTIRGTGYTVSIVAKSKDVLSETWGRKCSWCWGLILVTTPTNSTNENILYQVLISLKDVRFSSHILGFKNPVRGTAELTNGFRFCLLLMPLDRQSSSLLVDWNTAGDIFEIPKIAETRVTANAVVWHVHPKPIVPIPIQLQMLFESCVPSTVISDRIATLAMRGVGYISITIFTDLYVKMCGDCVESVLGRQKDVQL
jgi:hypothetical protein